MTILEYFQRMMNSMIYVHKVMGKEGTERGRKKMNHRALVLADVIQRLESNGEDYPAILTYCKDSIGKLQWTLDNEKLLGSIDKDAVNDSIEAFHLVQNYIEVQLGDDHG